MAKSMQALSEETRRLTFNERDIYIFKALQIRVQWLHLTTTKMGLALHCHGAQACKWKKWKRKRYKEDDEAVPTNPSTPPSSPK